MYTYIYIYLYVCVYICIHIYKYVCVCVQSSCIVSANLRRVNPSFLFTLTCSQQWLDALRVEQLFTYFWDATTSIHITNSAWFTLCMIRTCTYSRLLYSQNQVNVNRIPFSFFPPRIQHVGWALLDGDKIAALAACFVQSQLDSLRLSPPLSFAAVQTAYANGGSTAYLRSLGVPVVSFMCIYIMYMCVYIYVQIQMYMHRQLDSLRLSPPLSFAAVQTAYANGYRQPTCARQASQW